MFVVTLFMIDYLIIISVRQMHTDPHLAQLVQDNPGLGGETAGMIGKEARKTKSTHYNKKSRDGLTSCTVRGATGQEQNFSKTYFVLLA
jgi:hypothetical protein